MHGCLQVQKPDGSSYGRTTLNGLQCSNQYFGQDHKGATGKALHLPLNYEDVEFEDFVRAVDMKLKKAAFPCLLCPSQLTTSANSWSLIPAV